MFSEPVNLEFELQQLFGFSVFRPNQREIVTQILGKRDVFAVMPTGGGKSLCYQLPAKIMPGTCVVISPLISLMKDQVDGARMLGLNAAYLNSSLSRDEAVGVWRDLREGNLDLLYVAPERFTMDDFIQQLEQIPISFFAIDEAHCISEWGHDFRPDYLSLEMIKKRFPDHCLAAFTATATVGVQDDIISKLGLWHPFRVRASFNRPNLFYEISPKIDVESQLLKFIKNHPQQAGIIYRLSRKKVEETASYLSARGIKAIAYHAGLPQAVRQSNQDLFNSDAVQVVVATVAFGMGIDKSNVRYVLHGDLPKSMEGYYQETGRAGRDGEPSHCVLYFSKQDIFKTKFIIEKAENPEERARALKQMNQMVDFADSKGCRRRHVLNYFQETYPDDNCGGCDHCIGGMILQDRTTEAQKVISAMVRTGQQYQTDHIVSIVLGDEQKVGLNHPEHLELPTFGVGKDQSPAFWQELVEELVQREYLRWHPEDDAVPVMTHKGQKLLRGKVSFSILKAVPRPKPTAGVSSQSARRAVSSSADFDESLFEELRELRKSLANKEKVPPFIIFSDRTLHDMCRRFPESKTELQRIDGVSKNKLRKFGEDFIAVISRYVKMNPDLVRDFR